jgi:hypothetical protein
MIGGTRGGNDGSDVHHRGEIGTQRTMNNPFLVRQMSKRDDTSTDIATRAAHCGSLLKGLSLSYAQA